MYQVIVVLSIFVNVVLTSPQYTCLDCNTSAILLKGRKVASARCSGSTPYCSLSTGTCSPHPDSHCGQTENEFNCTGDGYFPDENCAVYHICQDHRSTKFQCGGAYNAEKRVCEKSRDICGTFNCTNSDQLSSHSIYPQYYAKCFSDGRSPLIYSCPDQHQWSPVTQRCEAHCIDEILMADVNDCRKYFRCEMDATNLTLEMIPEDCPEGQGFDVDSSICVSLSSKNLTNCSSRTKRSLSDDNPSKSDLFCLEDGLYPAENCHEYYSCENYEPSLKNCDEPTEIFNPLTGTCQEGDLNCGQYNCTSLGRKSPHTVFPSYYAYCGPDIQPLTLGRCHGELEMDQATQTCVTVCRSQGLKPDSDDCSKYYRCRRHRVNETYSIYKSESHNCPKDLAFDPIRLNCSKGIVCSPVKS